MKNIEIFKRVGFVDKLMFTKHLSIMMRSGVPITEALEILAENAKQGYFKKVINEVLENVNAGKPIYRSLGKYPKVFNNFYVNLIKIGEEAGSLEQNLDFLAKQMEKDYSLRKKIQGAMFYPAIIFTAGTGIGGFISLFVLPQLVDFFDSLDVELPLSTKILLGFATVMKAHGFLIIGGIAGFFIFMSFLVKTKHVKPIWHSIILKIPLLGKVTLYGQISRMCRNFGTMIKSGVPAPHALETSAKTLSNVVLERHFLYVQQELIKGKSIGNALEEGHFKEIPTIVIHMLKVAEKTGNLEEVLIYLGDFYEEEIDSITKNLTTILEPLMLIVIGAGVAFVAFAIIGPIYKLTGSVRN